MANRFMVDCTHANLHNIDPAFLKANQLIAGYDTGNPDTQWTNADWQYVESLGLIPVHIDQGFTGSPVSSDVVRDVEPGAWNAVIAETEKPWTAERKTIYCDRNDLIEVLQLGWTGDIWLAWPLSSIPTKEFVLSVYPALTQANLVAVQIGFTNVYDHSVVYDSTWPLKGFTVPTVSYPGIPGNWVVGTFTITPGVDGHWHGEGIGGDGNVFTTNSVDNGKTWSAPARV